LKLASLLFLMEFYERLVFKEGYTTSVLSGTNY
jgi:hypothetical protein